MDQQYIKSVDTEKPLGQMVENYANMRWWRGFSIGWIGGITYSSLLFLYFHYKK
jgi:hypothetical protein